MAKNGIGTQPRLCAVGESVAGHLESSLSEWQVTDYLAPWGIIPFSECGQ